MSANSPKISVIVPVYNVEPYLRECIESILRQSYKEFELILINDNSIDLSYKICQEYVQKDSRVYLVNHTENKGLSAARNTGLSVAKSECITFIDGDDFIKEDYLEKLYTVYKEKNADIVIGEYYTYKESNHTFYFHVLEKDYGLYRKNREELFGPNLHHVTYSITCGKLYKKSLFDTILFPLNRYHEDNFVFTKLYLKAKNIYYLCDNLYCYRIRDGSIMQSPISLKRVDDELTSYEENILDLCISGEDTLLAIDHYKARLMWYKGFLEARELTSEYIYLRICNKLDLIENASL